MASLANKTALVTGASRGIGRATAEALAKMGAHLIVHYGRSRAEADALMAGIRAAGGSAWLQLRRGTRPCARGQCGEPAGLAGELTF